MMPAMVAAAMPARAVAIALVLAFVSAGCGASGGSDDGRGDYVKALNTAQTGLQQRFTQLGAKVTATSTPEQDRRTLAAYQTAVTATVHDLRDIRPPSGLEGLHRQFVGEIQDFGAALRSARSRIASGNALAARTGVKAAAEQTGRRVNATIEAINKKLEG
jgi:hypothetical protein